MERGTREEMLNRLAEVVASARFAHPTRVAVDGPPASGKTTLAEELAVVLTSRGRSVIRASIDDFLFPRAQRYRRGEYSADACYFDTHDCDALNAVLLDPLVRDRNRHFRRATYDRATDSAVSASVETAPADAVLIFDGVFLMRPELNNRWDLRILVLTSLDETVNRALKRERRLSPPAEVERRWRERYIPAQQLYFARVRPADHADIVVNNEKPERPEWRRSTL